MLLLSERDTCQDRPMPILERSALESTLQSADSSSESADSSI